MEVWREVAGIIPGLEITGTKGFFLAKVGLLM